MCWNLQNIQCQVYNDSWRQHFVELSYRGFPETFCGLDFKPKYKESAKSNFSRPRQFRNRSKLKGVNSVKIRTAAILVSY